MHAVYCKRGAAEVGGCQRKCPHGQRGWLAACWRRGRLHMAHSSSRTAGRAYRAARPARASVHRIRTSAMHARTGSVQGAGDCTRRGPLAQPREGGPWCTGGAMGRVPGPASFQVLLRSARRARRGKHPSARQACEPASCMHRPSASSNPALCIAYALTQPRRQQLVSSAYGGCMPWWGRRSQPSKQVSRACGGHSSSRGAMPGGACMRGNYHVNISDARGNPNQLPGSGAHAMLSQHSSTRPCQGTPAAAPCSAVCAQ